MEGLWRGGGLERRGRGGPLTGAARAVRQAVDKPRSPLGYTPALAALPAGARQGLPEGVDDQALAAEAQAVGLAPVPLSLWYAEPPRRSGLLLGVTNLVERRLASDCDRLLDLLPRAERRVPSTGLTPYRTRTGN